LEQEDVLVTLRGIAPADAQQSFVGTDRGAVTQWARHLETRAPDVTVFCTLQYKDVVVPDFLPAAPGKRIREISTAGNDQRVVVDAREGTGDAGLDVLARCRRQRRKLGPLENISSAGDPSGDDCIGGAKGEYLSDDHLRFLFLVRFAPLFAHTETRLSTGKSK
jgi:hypothetical protein